MVGMAIIGKDTIEQLADMTIPSTTMMSRSERLAGTETMVADLTRLAEEDGCIAAAWALEMLDAMALVIDAHKGAGNDAFDDIQAVCAAPEWDYPGQVVRDVLMAINWAHREGAAGREIKQTLIERLATRHMSPVLADLIPPEVPKEPREKVDCFFHEAAVDCPCDEPCDTLGDQGREAGLMGEHDVVKAKPNPCLDPDKMHGAGDGFGGSDY